jgi:ribosomal protein S18 acetylase RimI-like enzyme
MQVKGPGSPDFDALRIGTHVRIGNIEVDSPYRKRGIGTEAMLILLVEYIKKRGFECFKLEASDCAPHLSRCYTQRLGFKRVKHIEEDVWMYIRRVTQGN